MNAELKQALSPKAITLGFGGACLAYLCFVGISFMQGSDALEKLEAKMAAQSIAFENPMAVIAEQHHGVTETTHETVSHDAPHEDLSDQLGASKEPLAPAPFDGLTEETQFGQLPQIGKNKLKPFDAYKKQYVYDVGKPLIGIGVTGIGFSHRLYDGIYSKLSPQASLILSPYVDRVHDIQKEARSLGYETWLEIPFENKDFPNDDPGPKGILSSLGLKFNQDNYRSILASTAGYAGLAGYTDSAFKDAHTMLGGLLSDAFGRGLGFFEMNSGKDAMSQNVAISARAPHLSASIPLKPETVSQRFSALKKQAKKEKRAIGVIEISPAMLANFQKEILKAKQEGFEVVPLSVLADRF